MKPIINFNFIKSNLNFKSLKHNQSSFTLIELLIVIAILAILSIVIVVVINPTELLRQSRDSTRLSDLQTINKALSLAIVDQPGIYLGQTNTVYTSLIDPNSTSCASLALPALPPGYSYRCSTSTSQASKIDGTGWLPVNFTTISFSSPISKLPLDPINDPNTGEYYTYIPGGSYHLAAYLTSNKYKLGGDKDNVSKDGGSFPELYEIGTNLKLLPVSRDPSLVGYWTFDEGSGTTAYDRSGKGNHGTLQNGPQWVDGKVGKALSFDGTDDYVNILNSNSLNVKNITMMAYIKLFNYSCVSDRGIIFNKESAYEWGIRCNSGNLDAAMVPNWEWYGTTDIILLNSFVFVVVSWDGDKQKYYINGDLKLDLDLNNGNINENSNCLKIAARGGCGAFYSFFNGLIDDVRIYNRALSAAEIKAIYEATK